MEANSEPKGGQRDLDGGFVEGNTRFVAVDGDNGADYGSIHSHTAADIEDSYAGHSCHTAGDGHRPLLDSPMLCFPSQSKPEVLNCKSTFIDS